MQKVKFVKNDNDIVYNPKQYVSTFYQFCKFKNSGTNLYETRKIFFNEKGEILKVYERSYDLQTVKKFIKETRDNKYKIYATTGIKMVAYPNTSDMTQSKSELLNGNIVTYSLDNNHNNFSSNISYSPL
ncbi:hypothetical protein BMW23_0573 [Bodo saltans virus]|uniref:Uncharacterized protein n=1 Tax=Bodo saltans virus TaxID=2024608 RepID=A0A2H4UUM5_9VIRU|nr:hypothetical protein QJ851_gp0557 [Bodo saltans virus]ATZ80620.1 hypothetical protein BMW23_0573 [Bodo saltans virus]